MTEKSKAIQDATPNTTEQAYITWQDSNLEDKRQALNEASKGLEEFGLVDKTVANSRYRLSFKDLDGPTSSRPGLTRTDYDYFRPDEAVASSIKGIFYQADLIYNRVGLVKNVIDLMGDFASQGIRLTHKNPRIQKFYKNWFAKVNGIERSERFLNNLYRIGNVVINRQTAKISIRVADSLFKSVSSPDLIINNDEYKIEKREIPWKYTFIDPLCVDVVGGSLSSFVQDKAYSIILPANLRKIINNPKNEAEKNIVNQLPPAILEAAKTRKPYNLDSDKTLVFHYKKDDWKTWAYPMIYSIMDDINIIEKLKLADLAALDGAISNIRIFKLGSLEHKVAPTKAATAKLAQILQNNVGGGTMDLVWGPDIELIESKTNVHQFLGEGKYTPHLNSVYAGLGIPPTLTGTFGAAGTTNNFISLKTLTQRLQYGRKILAAFWKQEIALVQKAMGFRFPAKVEFDRMDLSNEDSEKALLIQLADRNIISDELLQTAFGFDPDMEKTRVKREQKQRDSNSYVAKSGPFYKPEIDKELKKIALQNGTVAPSEVGLELEPKKTGEKSALDLKSAQAPKGGGPVGVSGQGRPKNSKDGSKRKEKKFAPQTGASIHLWALEAQDKINEIINPYLLEFYKKKNMRSLSSLEYNEAETIKNKILFSLDISEKLTDDYLLSKLQTIDSEAVKQSYAGFIRFRKDFSHDLTTDQIKNLKSFYIQEKYSV